MFKSFFGNKMQEIKEDKKCKEIESRVAKMDVYYMFNYLEEENSCELGIELILKKLMHRDKSVNRRFIEISDSKFKIDKCFELIISILEHNNATNKIVVLCEKFTFMFSDIIKENDEKNLKDYEAKLNDALFFATKKFTKNDEENQAVCDIDKKMDKQIPKSRKQIIKEVAKQKVK